ncbi:hypothetical protein VPH35_083380 [Triticum aestivum]
MAVVPNLSFARAAAMDWIRPELLIRLTSRPGCKLPPPGSSLSSKFSHRRACCLLHRPEHARPSATTLVTAAAVVYCFAKSLHTPLPWRLGLEHCRPASPEAAVPCLSRARARGRAAERAHPVAASSLSSAPPSALCSCGCRCCARLCPRRRQPPPPPLLRAGGREAPDPFCPLVNAHAWPLRSLTATGSASPRPSSPSIAQRQEGPAPRRFFLSLAVPLQIWAEAHAEAQRLLCIFLFFILFLYSLLGLCLVSAR